MSAGRRDRTTLWKALAICGIGMMVGFGSCGVAFLRELVYGGGRFDGYIAQTGAVLFCISLLGFVLSFVIFTVNKPKE